MRKKMINLSASLLGVATVASTLFSCNTQQQESPMKAKVEEYAQVELKSDLVNNLNDKEKELVKIFFQVGEITDDLFWQQTFGDKSQLDTITDNYAKEFAMIHYGAWDRLDNNKPFLAGYGEKPAVCNYYPHDITAEEFDAFEDANKNSWYTVIRRNEDGSLKSVWYHEAYAEEIGRICALLEKAVTLAEDPGLKNYLEKRIEAFKTDDYLESDLAWMDMKDSKIDFVTGPIESYDDKFQETKASYESFILLKDEARSKDLAKFVAMLPALQKELPCAPEYKTFVPGTSSDLNVYDAVYYAGDCNAGSKTIAINLPNDVDEDLVNRLYVEAWKSGCKGCTVYRDGSRSGVLISTKSDKDKKEGLPPCKPPTVVEVRPRILEADVVRFQNNKEKWVAFVGLLDGHPYEIFTGLQDDDEGILLPKSVTCGRIIKNVDEDGTKRYDFQFENKRGYKTTIEGLSEKFNKEYWNYAKLISGVLRYRMPIEQVIKLVGSLQLNSESINTWKNGVERALKKYIQDGTEAKGKKCPNCGNETLVYQEGCLICTTCGASRCG